MFHKLRVSKKFMIKWVMSRSSVEFFLSRKTEKLHRGNPSAFHKNFVDMCGWSEYHNFLSNFFCLTAPKTFMKKPSTVALVLVIKTFYDKLGYVTIFCRIFLSRSNKKVFVEEPFSAVFQETSAGEKVYG